MRQGLELTFSEICIKAGSNGYTIVNGIINEPLFWGGPILLFNANTNGAEIVAFAFILSR